MFVGHAKDGAELYDTKEAAIERAKILIQWGDDPYTKIMTTRKRMPLWFAHLFRETVLEWVAYKEIPIN